jgi:hypothetical protein
MDTATTTVTALHQLLEPLSRSLNVEAARAIVGLRIDPSVQARIDELADRCSEGLLTEAERGEYEGFVEGVGLVNVLRAKARHALSARVPS